MVYSLADTLGASANLLQPCWNSLPSMIGCPTGRLRGGGGQLQLPDKLSASARLPHDELKRLRQLQPVFAVTSAQAI